MTYKSLVLSFSMALGLAAGCGDDGGGKSGPSVAELKADWATHCDDRATECPDRAGDPASCKAQFDCLSVALRLDLLEKTVACASALTCEQGDDPCFDLETQGLQPTAKAAQFKQDCLAKKATCDANGGGVKDDLCLIATSMTDELVTAIGTCLEGTCDDFGPCFEAKITAVSPACAE